MRTSRRVCFTYVWQIFVVTVLCMYVLYGVWSEYSSLFESGRFFSAFLRNTCASMWDIQPLLQSILVIKQYFTAHSFRSSSHFFCTWDNTWNRILKEIFYQLIILQTTRPLLSYLETGVRLHVYLCKWKRSFLSLIATNCVISLQWWWHFDSDI